ncbi:hypothetical protein BGZ95_006009 [Linnemannia exigua]|uniref:Glyoxal oxidase n=1 Tax=Linnemannia exigua TaxID=604196 RepID=A0AAD4DGG1_9FUNG|nr:hypothetical protein BGZ95_006009 [Linnemannia exigua]
MVLLLHRRHKPSGTTTRPYTRKHTTILTLGQATTHFLLGALLVLSSSPSFSQSSSGSSLIMGTDASSLFESLNNFIRTNNANSRHQHLFQESGKQKQDVHFENVLLEEEAVDEDQDAEKGTLASILDSVYSLAAKKVGATKPIKPTTPKPTGDEEAGLHFQYQGTSRHLGQWDLVGVSGVSAMHATLIPNTNKIVFLEKVEKNTHAFLTENAAKFSYSVEYDIDESTFRPLHTKTNQFCSAGGYRPDGTIVSLGGAEAQADVAEGWNSLRFLSSCNATHSRCDWDTRNDITLKTGRWYPTVEALADGRLFILGGATRGASMNDKEISVPSWELYPPLESNPTHFAFLEETLPYNLYPTWSIIKNLPELPGPPRNYPLSGGSVLLPLRPESNYEAEILICGGATEFSSHGKGQDQCGRIKPLAKDADWVMEDMPMGRMMPDMTLLPDGSVMMFNGASRGTAGYGRAKDPVLHPIRYQPWESQKTVQANSRFSVQNPSYIPRLYHSIAIPVLDGRVMVAGSNPNANTLDWSEFPVEYRVEMFSPGYMFTYVPRPLLKAESTIGRTINQPEALSIQALQETNANPERGQGEGDTTENVILLDTVFEVEVQFYSGLITSETLTPPGWYQMTVVENGVPSEATWVRVQAL